MNLNDLWLKLKTMLNNPGAQRTQDTQAQQVGQSGRPTSMSDLIQQLSAGRQAQGQDVQNWQNNIQKLGQQQGAMQTLMQNAQTVGQGAKQAINPYLQKFLQLMQGGGNQ